MVSNKVKIPNRFSPINWIWNDILATELLLRFDESPAYTIVSEER
jgi:hypothetical protein